MKYFNMKKQYTLKEKEVRTLVKDLLKYVKKNNIRVILLKGDLGAGKTLFTQLIGKELGITEHITSPTYALMHTYSLSQKHIKNFIHIDAYRLDSTTTDDLGIKDYILENKSLIIIEWPDRIQQMLANVPRITISIKPHNDMNKRIYKISELNNQK